ncbi:MAG: MFS transporter [Ectothiorhodospiraceae bacterium]|jgi:predicted MFS family arabinose efflux permease
METNRQSALTGAVAVTLAAIAMLAVASGSRSVLGLLIPPLEATTGLGIATISLAVAASQLSWGIAQPFCGLLVERYGPARVLATGCLLAAASGALLPFVDSAPVLVTVLALGGIASAVGSPSLLIGTVSQRVAAHRRGLVAGVVGIGGPLGQLTLAPTTQAFLTFTGLTGAACFLAALALAAVPLALFFRRRRHACTPTSAEPESDATLSDALRSPRYWAINATFFICGFHVVFLVTHLPGVIGLCGLPAQTSGIALAVLGLFNMIGSIAAGIVTRWWSMTRTLAALFAARGLGIAVFLVAPKTATTVIAFSLWMGLTYMAVLPPIAGLIGKLYGARSLPTLLGLTFVVHQCGAFLGSWLGGVAVEWTGSYDRIWLIDLTLAALAAIISLAVGKRRQHAEKTLLRPVFQEG